MKKKLALFVFVLLPLISCGNDRPAADGITALTARQAAPIDTFVVLADSAHMARDMARAPDSNARTCVKYDYQFLARWVVNGRVTNAQLRQSNDWILRSWMMTYRNVYGVPWKPLAFYADSSDKPIAFYEQPATPEALSEERAALSDLQKKAPALRLALYYQKEIAELDYYAEGHRWPPPPLIGKP